MFKKLSKILLTVGMFILLLSVATFAQEQKKPMEKKMTSAHSKCDTDSSKSCEKSKCDSEKEGTAKVEIWNKVCPVMGKEIDKEVQTVEYKGKMIGFCCKGCITKFKKDPDKYMKNLSEDGSKFLKS